METSKIGEKKKKSLNGTGENNNRIGMGGLAHGSNRRLYSVTEVDRILTISIALYLCESQYAYACFEVKLSRTK